MKKFKIFAICCGMLVAGVLSTAKSYADGSNGKVKIGHCKGPITHLCKLTADGDMMFGYWEEATIGY